MHTSSKKTSGLLLLGVALASAGCGATAADTEQARTAPSTTPGALAAESLGAPAPGVIAFRRFLDEAMTTSAIFTIAPDGSHERQVSRPPDGRTDTQPTISADGQRLAWEYCQNAGDGSCHVMVSGIDGRHAREVRFRCPHGPVCDPQAPAWGPGGRLVIQLAWGRVQHDEIERSQVVVADADGRHARVVVDPAPFRAETQAPVWSPDGSRIAYESDRFSATGSLLSGGVAVVGADGGGQPRLITPTQLGAGDHVDWSPDGKWIAYRTHATEEGSPTELEEIHPDGTGRRTLTRFGDSDNAVNSSSFSPDGGWIVFGVQHGNGATSDLFIMRADGRDLRPLTKTALFESAPEWGR